ncbi:hypothetical protein GO988_15100 [Hymenobacter sp. HMF4947]|uniref:Tetratricopeptide repeat protein n=1 Tax=Hymenobacter ginkgonis TaxID=2682976 RepID=A0A7K1TGX4_9BACT|nr:hypothetical protein [Hymenobacter ginkgonis]MVN77658.1 hypothetical protein [Hymenobacter ginkgonis]
MTRASLLHLLAHPAALTGPDVRALEELAQAFPYCQTAHLLLAKAAHDQGSMLAAQRLRRAATYAADRAQLRQLIETPAPVAAVVVEETLPELAPLTLAPTPPAEPQVLPEIEVAPTASDTALEQGLPIESQSVAQLEDKPDQIIGLAEPEEELPVSPPLAEQEPPAPTPLVEEELPVQAPPIRPPAEAETARREFGLAAQEPAEIMAYRLPELEEAAPATPALATAATPLLPVFSGVADVGYAPSEGSRLGFCLVRGGEGSEEKLDPILPSATLPPAGEFFAPDALLLDHLTTHQPVPLPKVNPLDLINSFLQRAPTASRRRAMPTPAMPDTGTQADLSVRSTRPEPELASENLARILARQGKNERAIAVYERLMVKHPEKMAYFAAQIESLRPLA